MSELKCFVCENSHNSKSKTLPCKHNLCSFCYDEIKTNEGIKCPYCRKDHADREYPFENGLRKYIEECSKCRECGNLTETSKLVLNRKINKITCPNCVLKDEPTFDLLKREIDKKRSELEDVSANLNSNYKIICDFFKKQRKVIEDGFSNLFYQAKEKVEVFQRQVESFFDIQQNNLKMMFGEDSPLSLELVKKIKAFENFLDSENPNGMLTEDISKFKECIDLELLEQKFEGLQKDFTEILKPFETNLQNIIERIKSLHIPLHRLSRAASPIFSTNKSFTAIISPNSHSPYSMNCSFHQEPEGGDIEIVSVINPQESAVLPEGKKLNKATLTLDTDILNMESLSSLYDLWIKLGSLQNIRVEIRRQKKIPKERLMEVLSNVFCEQCVLQEVDFDFTGSAITDQDLILLTDKISGMTSLKAISLNLWETKVSQLGVKALASKIFCLMKELKRIAIDLGLTKIEEAGLISLFNSIPKDVKHLAISLNEVRLDNEELICSLISLIKSSEAVEVLDLELRNTKLSDKIACRVLESFRELKELRNLRVNLNSNNISEDCLKEFSENILKDMKLLKKLNINLEGTCIPEPTKFELLKKFKQVGSNKNKTTIST